MITKRITNRLREHRIAANMEQSDVASLLGLASTNRISKWETGSMYPHIINLFKLAIAYNTTVEFLYSELYEELKAQVLGSSPCPVTNSNLEGIEDKNVENKP